MKPEALSAGEVIERYIRANYRERISVQDAAMAACVSESHACRVLKRRLGLSPIQLINNLRLEEARRLLIATDSAVEQVSQEAGFASSKYFSRIFRGKNLAVHPAGFEKAKGKPPKKENSGGISAALAGSWPCRCPKKCGLGWILDKKTAKIKNFFEFFLSFFVIINPRLNIHKQRYRGRRVEFMKSGAT